MYSSHLVSISLNVTWLRYLDISSIRANNAGFYISLNATQKHLSFNPPCLVNDRAF